jgi:CheY-like chemotaxis protein
MGHASRLEQVFLNLLINAVQALPSDRVHDNCIRIRTGLERRGCSDWVVVEVADNGAGIPPGLVDRVFDPFFTTKPVGMGTGLGLPICHSIVTRMGGNVAVKSELGEGTSFFVSLPVASADTLHAAIPPAISVVRSTRRAKILVIDDEPAVATTLSRLLGEEHDVVVATDGQHALECLERQSFDVVLCDLLMPEMSGMELYEELRRRNPAQAERVAFMSGGAFTPRAASFLAQVQNPRIEKPFDLLAVLGLVARITGQAQGA